MSGLELVAGIAGVAAAAIKVSVSMNDLAEELGSAGRDVRYIGNDMAGFAQVLRLVQSSLEESIKTSGSAVIQSVFDTLPQLVEQCSMVHDEANGLMVALKLSNNKEKSINFFQRLRFVFYKGRITILRSLLDSSKSTLNLLLVTLNIEMAKSKSPDKALMEQLQNERKAFIRVVHSQNKALDEAMKEVEKAKKEAAKFKAKRDKEKAKENDEAQNQEEDILEDPTIVLPKRNSTPYSYKPPPPYTLHSAPSVSQLVYQPPSLERFNSVRNSSKAVTTLALSLEPVRPTSTYGMPTPPTSPPGGGPYPAYPFQHSNPQPQPPSEARPNQDTNTPSQAPLDDNTSFRQSTGTRPQPGKRVFSDPGPAQSSNNLNDRLNPGAVPRERSRSPYGFSRVPQDELPKVERKRPPFQSSASEPKPTYSTQTNHRTFSTPAYGASNMGSVPEEKEPTFPYPRSPATSPTTEPRKPSFTYYPPPPPPPPTYTEQPTYTQYGGAPSPHQPPPPHQAPPPHQTSPPPQTPQPHQTSPPPRKPIPPPPPPRHGTTYIVTTPYLSHEIGHLSLIPFDTLVDVVSHIPDDTDLPYPTAFDASPKHFWQASLGSRRGPRGLFPTDVVCAIDDERVTKQVAENWFADGSVGFIVDGQGRCWVGPGWLWKEPEGRRREGWAQEF